MSGADRSRLCSCAMPGTDVGSAAMLCTVLTTDVGYAATRFDTAAGAAQVNSAISLRACYASSTACYAISSTNVAYDVMSLRASYAMYGTNMAYDAIIISLRACYAMSGTNTVSRYDAMSLRADYAILAYALAMPYPVSKVAYGAMSRYAIPGT
eukprot:3448291-Rhodomonas_salina.5